MWAKIRRVGSAVAGAIALGGALLANPALAEDGQATFVAEDKSISFGFTVPSIQNDDLFFSIRVHKDRAWGAIGLGSDDMAGALVLMLYMNEKGDNVTFSPRTAHGHYEPVPYPNPEYQILDPTGIYGDYLVFSAHCFRGCRNWPGGWIDVTDDNQHGIYAVGPKQSFRSDDPNVSVKYHAQFGSFEINMHRTLGIGDAPVLDGDSKTSGVKESEWGMAKGRVDGKSTAHAVVMVLVFIFLLPVGTVLLRMGGWVKWHAVNQGVALVGTLAGFALGIVTSFHYTRSRGFSSPHQIIGYIVVAGLIAQFVIGLLHHIKYRRTQETTKLAPVHVWMGRLILFLGAINAFIGFRFALNTWNNLILAGLILVFTGLLAFISFSKPVRQRLFPRTGLSNGVNPAFGFGTGRNNNGGGATSPPSPWRQSHNGEDYGGGSGNKSGGGFGAGLDPGRQEYAPSPQQIGLMDVRRSKTDLGPVQTPRDMI